MVTPKIKNVCFPGLFVCLSG